MNVLLILRSEIVCIVILLFLFFYSKIYDHENAKNFLEICFFTLGHVIFDAITVYTVNNLDTVPAFINWICHVIYYIFAMLFCHYYYVYIIKLMFSTTGRKKFIVISRIITLPTILILPFLQFNYIVGRGTNYSMGTAAYLGYSVAFLHIFASLFIILIGFKKLDKSVRIALVPYTIFTMLALITQVLVPELLATGSAATLVAVGVFFAVENPIGRYKQRAYIDLDTGVKNRNFYDEDIKQLNTFIEGATKKRVACFICDLNNLKFVNDTYGHTAGDELIRSIAKALSDNLKSAHNIYRIGGDEFLAFYIGDNIERAEAEISALKQYCETNGANSPHELSIAIGFRQSDEHTKDILDIVKLADIAMYENKLKMKAELASTQTIAAFALK